MANEKALPYNIQIKENGISKVSTFYLTKNDLANLGYDHIVKENLDGTRIILDPSNLDPESGNTIPTVNYICEVIGPKELDLLPALPKTKATRPKKKQDEKEATQIDTKMELLPRTRSGRLVKFPKHIVKDFKKIDLTDEQSRPEENIKVTEFTIGKEPCIPDTQKPKIEALELHQRKRKIAAQYRCPHCKKAYLGKNKMLEHLKRYPSHGPATHNDLNFEVWNYLVSLTQKCTPSQRGTKFCEELTNLLHNLLLLTNALFKTDESASKNKVSVDKVLGNAIGLPPGQYYFNDSKLHKDVTILRLLDNEYLFKDSFLINTNNKQPSSTRDEQNYTSSSTQSIKSSSESKQATEMVCDSSNNDFCDKIAVTSEVALNYPQIFTMENLIHTGFDINMSESPPKSPHGKSSRQELGYKNHYEENNMKMSFDTSHAVDSFDSQTSVVIDRYNQSRKSEQCFKANPVNEVSFGDCRNLQNEKVKHHQTNEQMTVHSSLLSAHSLLSPLPHLRNSVDEALILAETSNLLDSSTTHLLDNSSSSDEVMNVDQFVNERFKKITEPEIELSSTSLNLDLPSLDMFEFHTS